MTKIGDQVNIVGNDGKNYLATFVGDGVWQVSAEYNDCGFVGWHDWTSVDDCDTPDEVSAAVKQKTTEHPVEELKKVPANVVEGLFQTIEALQPVTAVLEMATLPRKGDSIEEVLSRDAIAECEEMFGKVDGVGTPLSEQDRRLLMLAHSMRINKKKDEVLTSRDDTTFSDTLERYHRIITDLGFEKVFELPFTSKYGDDEKLFAFFRRKGGILLVHDTFGGKKVNGGHFYYNWKPNWEKYKHTTNVVSSGGFRMKNEEDGKVPYSELYPGYGKKTEDPAVLERERLWKERFDREAVWVGDHDCREAVRHHISLLEEHGTFLDQWEFQNRIWFIHYGDNPEHYTGKTRDGRDYDEVVKERLAMLPEYVRKAILAD